MNLMISSPLFAGCRLPIYIGITSNQQRTFSHVYPPFQSVDTQTLLIVVLVKGRVLGTTGRK